MSADSNRVQVFVRCRPRIMTSSNALHAAERHAPDGVTKNGDANVTVAEKRTTASGDSDVRSQEFAFDGMFDPETTQEELYEYTTIDAVDAATQGFDCTLFAYGQTGSGKTFTVLGKVVDNNNSNNNTAASPAAVASPITPFPPSSPSTTNSNNNASLVPDFSGGIQIHPDSGLFLRVLHDLLHFAHSQKQFHMIISINVQEVYLDTVRDLLAKDPSAPLKVLITDDHVSIPDLTYKEVKTLQDAVKIFEQASKKRIARSTDSNDASSRSHALFNIDIFRQPITDVNKDRPLTISDIVAAKKPPATTTATSSVGIPSSAAKRPAVPAAMTAQYAPICGNGNMFMIPSAVTGGTGHPPVLASRITLTDLAGSEKMKTNNSKGEAFDEMVKINGSLTALGNVVHCLFVGSKHIPYRDTKLTVLLRAGFSSIGSKIVLIANIAPTTLTFDETYATLLFANKVKAMKTDKNAGKSNTGQEFQLQHQLTNLLRSFDEFACDLRVFSAQQSPDDAKTKAINAMIRTKMTRKAECTGKPESDARATVVKAIAENAKKARSDALESILTDVPKKALSEHVAAMTKLKEELERRQASKSSSSSDGKKLDDAIAEMQKELNARKPELGQCEEKKKSLAQSKAKIDGELEVAARQLAATTAVSDPEAQKLKKESQQDETFILQADKVFTTSFTPMIENIKNHNKEIQELLLAREKRTQVEANRNEASAEFEAEIKLYDPAAIKARDEVLVVELAEDLKINNWIIIPDEDQTRPNNNNIDAGNKNYDNNNTNSNVNDNINTNNVVSINNNNNSNNGDLTFNINNNNSSNDTITAVPSELRRSPSISQTGGPAILLRNPPPIRIMTNNNNNNNSGTSSPSSPSSPKTINMKLPPPPSSLLPSSPDGSPRVGGNVVGGGPRGPKFIPPPPGKLLPGAIGADGRSVSVMIPGPGNSTTMMTRKEFFESLNNARKQQQQQENNGGDNNSNTNERSSSVSLIGQMLMKKAPPPPSAFDSEGRPVKNPIPGKKAPPPPPPSANSRSQSVAINSNNNNNINQSTTCFSATDYTLPESPSFTLGNSSPNNNYNNNTYDEENNNNNNGSPTLNDIFSGTTTHNSGKLPPPIVMSAPTAMSHHSNDNEGSSSPSVSSQSGGLERSPSMSTFNGMKKAPPPPPKGPPPGWISRSVSCAAVPNQSSTMNDDNNNNTPQFIGKMPPPGPPQTRKSDVPPPPLSRPSLGRSISCAIPNNNNNNNSNMSNNNENNDNTFAPLPTTFNFRQNRPAPLMTTSGLTPNLGPQQSGSASPTTNAMLLSPKSTTPASPKQPAVYKDPSVNLVGGVGTLQRPLSVSTAAAEVAEEQQKQQAIYKDPSVNVVGGVGTLQRPFTVDEEERRRSSSVTANSNVPSPILSASRKNSDLNNNNNNSFALSPGSKNGSGNLNNYNNNGSFGTNSPSAIKNNNNTIKGGTSVMMSAVATSGTFEPPTNSPNRSSSVLYTDPRVNMIGGVATLQRSPSMMARSANTITPPDDELVKHEYVRRFGKYIGCDVDKDPADEELLPVVLVALRTPLPPNFRAVADPSSGRTYFVNTGNNETSWDHPMRNEFKQRIVDAREQKKKEREAGGQQQKSSGNNEWNIQEFNSDSDHDDDEK